jgi:UDP-N-acetyl-D-mannosaminuronic acid dehydrogenase
MKKNILIVGGAGHIGLPLGLLFADKGQNIILYDKNKKTINKINSSKMPFMEDGGNKLLLKNKKRIFATNKKLYVKKAEIIIICIGTPIKKNKKPDLVFFFKLFIEIKSLLNPDQLIIIRSSIFPGTCQKVSNFLGKNFKNISYCPERVVQGKSVTELPKLPQIISGLSKKAIIESQLLFNLICQKTIVTSVTEAELIKLFSNAWRYINFSIANQFYMICENLGINFKSLRKNMITGYVRNKGIPLPGFAAGPCLYKDTEQLNSYFREEFNLGKIAIGINESLPNFIYKKLKNKFRNNLRNKVIGILGIAFKANIDDVRDSLAIKLMKLLQQKGFKVIFSDYLVKMKNNISTKKLVSKSDIIIIGAPHNVYKNLKFKKDKYLVDTWGMFK